MFRYDYIAVVDIDEVIMPRQHKNWKELIREIKRKTPEASNNISTFVFRHALFLDKEEEDVVVMDKESSDRQLSNDTEDYQHHHQGVTPIYIIHTIMPQCDQQRNFIIKNNKL